MVGILDVGAAALEKGEARDDAGMMLLQAERGCKYVCIILEIVLALLRRDMVMN